jgi:DNA-directed RNA polymerase II subunit RPB1
MTTCVALLENLHTPSISNIQFGLMDPAVIRRQSVVHVVRATLYVRQLPAPNGLNDLRMGTSDRRLPCGTCKNDVLSCVGHPGHIELAAPVYHVSMLNIVVKILRCVCFFCSRLLMPPTDVDSRVNDDRFKKSDPKEKLNMLVNCCKTRHFCAHCSGPQPKYTQVRTAAEIRTEFRPKDLSRFENEAEVEFARRPFTAAMARAILTFIPDEEVTLMGINCTHARPEWLILTVLQVPPPIARPSIMATDGSRARGQDDITIKLQEIIKANLSVENALRSGAPAVAPLVPLFMQVMSPAVKTAVDLLQQHLVQFMHHDSTGSAAGGGGAGANGGGGGAPQRSSRPLRLVPARLKGKKGRFRGTLGGKRVDYSARTVVSPAPTYDIHEVGVPQAIAQHLTFPERVNALNIAALTRSVRNGPRHPQGASTVIMPDGTLLDLTLYAEQAACADFELQIGWVVERFLRDGDWVLFNRQPSLHRMSIMAHQVRITQDKTFRLPVCDTTPYNADFDGDEMNLHVLRSYEAVAEARELMTVTSQLLSPQSNKPIIGLVQDSLVAAFLVSSRDTFFTRAQIMQMVMPIKYPLFERLPRPAVLKPTALWTGKQLVSLLFPVFSLDLVVRNGTSDGVKKDQAGAMDVLERRVVIVRGELCAGTLCKKTLGTSAGGIIHVLVKDFGNTVASRFIGDAQRVLVEFMLLHGFSVGIGDCMMSRDAHDKVNASIDRCLAYADKIKHDAGGGAPVHLVEGCLTKLMNGTLNRTGAIVQQEVDPGNNVMIMVQSGAKGSAVNIAQILACVGQQSVEGGRIAADVDGRTLPCYSACETTAESRGFVANSYGTGLTAQEYFFHAMGGREGLVDTAVKTASTGYIQRRLVKAEEGLQLRYDHSVRNTRDQVVQFCYGGDGFDAVFVEKQVLRTYALSDAEVRARYAFSHEEFRAALHPTCAATVTTTTASSRAAWEEALAREYVVLLADRDAVRAGKLKIHGSGDPSVHVTVSVERILDAAMSRFCISRRASVPTCDVVHPRALTCLISKMTRKIEALSRHASASGFTLAYVRSVFCLRAIVVRYRLTLEAATWCAAEIFTCYRRSLASPGEMVGTIGAASIGEPCTQMTLNTFHTAGVAEKTVTLGVPRLKELIDTSRHIKTPSVSIYFTRPYQDSEKMAQNFGVALQFTLLNHVVDTSSVQYDPDAWNTVVADDRPIVDAYRALHHDGGGGGGAASATSPSAWLIRMVLDRDALVCKNLDVHHVAHALQLYMGDAAQIMCSELNMLSWVVRIRVINLADLMGDMEVVDVRERCQLEYACMKTIHDFLLDNAPIHGVPGIKRVMVHTSERATVGEGGTLVNQKEWMADTEGSNLRALLGLPCVDARRTVSNDIHEVLNVFGIEAAQQVLLDEIRAVLSFDGAYVNDRHLQLLADVMTLSGTLTAMTRHSMHKLGGSTYHHASFEETQDVLTNAAAYGVYDRIGGVTENLMMGMLMRGGTGCCDLIFPPSPSAGTGATIVRPLVLPTASDDTPLRAEPVSSAVASAVVVRPLVVPVPALVPVSAAPVVDEALGAHPTTVVVVRPLGVVARERGGGAGGGVGGGGGGYGPPCLAPVVVVRPLGERGVTDAPGAENVQARKRPPKQGDGARNNDAVPRHGKRPRRLTVDVSIDTAVRAASPPRVILEKNVISRSCVTFVSLSPKHAFSAREFHPLSPRKTFGLHE